MMSSKNLLLFTAASAALISGLWLQGGLLHRMLATASLVYGLPPLFLFLLLARGWDDEWLERCTRSL